MKYDIKYLDVKYALMMAFLINADKSLLDISYNVEGDKLLIQVVLIQGSDSTSLIEERIQRHLSEWQVELTILFISKERFNENTGEWNPKYYSWQKYLLFSKAAIV